MPDTEGILLKLLEGTAGSSGEGFFRDLVRALAEVLNVRYALVGELLVDSPGQVKTVAVFGGGGLTPDFVYDLAGTPCEQVMRQGLCVYPSRVAEEFPMDRELGQMEAESYLGVPLKNASGAIIGILAVLDTGPMRLDATTRTIFEIFAARAGAELERIRAERRREEAEAALRQAHKMEAMGTLAGGIAHDFNNILGAILGNAELASEDLAPDHPATESVTEVLRAARRGRHLVEQILTFSRRQDPDREVLSPRDVVCESLGMLRALLPAGVRLERRLAEDVPCVVADKGQLTQVLVNICTNAWQALEPDGGRVEIELGAEELTGEEARARGLLPGRHVRLSVKDDGCGMDEQTLRQVYDPFFTTKEPGRGTGLGLAVVHGIVEDHRGVVEIQSRVGQGTTVTVWLPASEAEPRDVTRLLRIEPFGEDRRILYLDDEESLVRTTGRSLSRLGFRVDGFQGATEALESFRRRQEEFDLVISDYAMPETDGVRFLSDIKAVRPDIPVLLVSGNLDDHITIAARSEGIEQLLRKPYTQADLARSVRRALGEHELEACL